jgi:hypothetical protein
MGAPATSAERLNYLGMLNGLNSVLRVEYKGEILPPGCILILAIIHAENLKTGHLCKRAVIQYRFGTHSLSGKYLLFLERSLLLRHVPNMGYIATVDGELLIRDVCTNLGRLLKSKPTRRQRKQASPDGPRPNPWSKHGQHNKRPLAPIETFNALVNEVLTKPGLNQKTKYVLLRALGMKRAPAQAALKQLQPLKNSERIKPVLAHILADIVQPAPTQNG